MGTKGYSIRLGPKGQALLLALTEVTESSQSYVVSQALEHFSQHIADLLAEHQADTDEGRRMILDRQLRTLKQALSMLGK